MKFSINKNVMVRLTDYGREIHQKAHEKFIKEFPSIPDDIKTYKPPKEDIQGWSEWQLWNLIETFGPHIHIGMNPPFETEIIIPRD